MRIMFLYKAGVESDAPPTPEMIEKMGAFIGEIAATGHLLSTDGLLPSSKGARVRYKGGKFTVVDGPFAETKELVSGFAIMQFDSMDEAKELAKRFLEVAGGGESEIRQMYDEAAFDASQQPQSASR